MGVTREVAARNREKILATAARLFREKGIDAVGLSELMYEAGFTQGGFYNHFVSKEALVSEVVANATAEGQQQLTAAVAQSRSVARDPLTRQIEWYLSEAQRDNVACGCPMAGFVAEIPRLSEKAQGSYAEALEQTFSKMAEMFLERDPKLTPGKARSRAISLFSHMVGAVLLSRAVSAKNPPLADEILKHSRSGILAELEKSPKPQALSKRQRTGVA
jgi:TetR/AcrR family transcriptional regulator, transcriptional repressor for nem operon